MRASPREEASVLSRLFFCWLHGLLKVSSKRRLTQDDLFDLSDEDQAEFIVQDFQEVWQEEILSSREHDRKPRLWRAMVRFLSWSDYFWLVFWKLFEALTMFSKPVMLWFLLKTFQDEISVEKKQYYLFAAAVGIGLVSFIFPFKYQNDLKSKIMGMRLTIACTGLIHQKILKSCRVNLSHGKPGHVFNLVSNDIERIRNVVHNAQNCASLIIATPITMGLLCTLIRWQAISGALFTILCAVSQIFVSTKFAHYRLLQAVATDERLSFVNEIIKGIRTVKMHAWEWSYLENIRECRRKEMTLARSKSFFLSVTAFLYVILVVFAIGTSVFTLLLSGFYVDAKQFFVLSLILQKFGHFAMVQISSLLYTYDSLSSISRIDNFLVSDNEDRSVLHKKTETKTVTFGKKSLKYSLLTNYEDKKFGEKVTPWKKNECGDIPSIHMKNVSSYWKDGQFTLHNISLQVEAGNLVMITGPVGSGKSTLLMTVLKEVNVQSGNILVTGNVAYVSQIPWIFTGTLRENILFGASFLQQQYEGVLEVCDLNQDIKMFPKADLTMIGQRGVMLSGGQRARVALARAVYSNAEILLLDDPLSAVDAKVGKHILEKCICEELSSKIRIVVTHQLQHLHRADKVVVLREGQIVSQGSYEQLTRNQSLDELIGEVKNIKFKKVVKQSGLARLIDEIDTFGIDLHEEDEETDSDSRSWRLYWNYFRIGLPSVIVLLLGLLVFVSRACPYVCGWWLKVMSGMSKEDQRGPFALGVYGGLLLANLVIPFLEVWVVLLALLKSSDKMHDKMIKAVLMSPVRFFDTNPVGRIINHFAKDVGTTDDSIPIEIVLSLLTICSYLIVSFLIVVVNQWYFLVSMPTVALFFVVCRWYLKPSRNLYALEALRCSSVYDHVSETMEGLEVIHSAKMEDVNFQKLYSLIDKHTQAFSLTIAMDCRMGFHVDLICALFITSIAIATIIMNQDAGTAGLVLAIPMTLIGNLGHGIQKFTSLETLMVSVERLMKYTQLPPEPGYKREQQPPKDWPNKGALFFKNMSLAYLEGGACVLEDITFDVKPQERIGIAGRTGAGKSSLVAALFRMPDPLGCIIIDDIDLSTLNIQSVRRSMAVIAQNPILFSGSLKHSLDPFNYFTEEQIWAALDAVQMKERVSKLEGLLEHMIGDGGSGFSVGETQLLCLARAILQRCKIIVLDEATANVDYKTDQLVQKVIRDKFCHCTVLTIAHRLDTIMNYDRVLVLDHGHVVQFDRPEILAADGDGVFAKLLQSQQGSFI